MFKSFWIAGSATLSVEKSIKTILEARIVAVRVHFSIADEEFLVIAK